MIQASGWAMNLIFGDRGTGRTTGRIRALLHFASTKEAQRVLFVAHHHAMIDHALKCAQIVLRENGVKGAMTIRHPGRARIVLPNTSELVIVDVTTPPDCECHGFEWGVIELDHAVLDTPTHNQRDAERRERWIEARENRFAHRAVL